MEKKLNILLGITGSVASILYSKLIQELKQLGDVKLILTDKAKTFINFKQLVQVIDENDIYDDSREWPEYKRHGNHRPWEKGDSITHVELRQWADVLVIAPLSANTLAKMANGLCDNLLTSVCRAWDNTKPIVVAPAMNTMMYEHPITKQHLDVVHRWFDLFVVPPVSKKLACGESGMGALADISDIGKTVVDSVRWEFPISLHSSCPGIPVENHPGAFGYRRFKSHHTGVDMYTGGLLLQVDAVEGGTVVGIEPFTGVIDNTPHWNNTWCVLVEGCFGVVCYGEISPRQGLSVGMKVRKGEAIGNVIQVLKDGKERPDINGHSKCMLHLELYIHGQHKASTTWPLDTPCHDYLRDPTSYLLTARNSPGILRQTTPLVK